jgi:hypothetical protein
MGIFTSEEFNSLEELFEHELKRSVRRGDPADGCVAETCGQGLQLGTQKSV